MSETIESGPHEIICQKWEESERGWGVRPYGFSLHVSLTSLERFVKKYWDSMPHSVHDEYARPSGIPYPLNVSDEVLQKVTESTDGIRLYNNNYPGSGGVDGWKNRARGDANTVA